MTTTENQTSSAKRLEDLYQIETKLFSTRTADLYIAQDTRKGLDVTVWQLRTRLPVGSTIIGEYNRRMEILAAVEPSVCEFLGFGVDDHGVAFAVLPRLDGNTLFEGNPEISEIERRFDSAIELVSRIHSSSIVCGDICRNSFWLSRTGSVRFIGVMGAYEDDPTEGKKLYPESVHFLAPEQRDSGTLALSTDVYALGVLGYLMLTGTFPAQSGQIKKISEIKPNAPFWADTIFTKALASNPSNRYSSATEMLQALRDLREKHSVDGKVPHSDSADQRKFDDNQHAAGVAGRATPFYKTPGFTKIVVKLVIVAGLIAVGMIVILPIYTQYANQQRLTKSLVAHQAVAGDQLRKAIEGLLSAGSSVESKKPFLNQIVDSEDPVAHAVLVSLSRNTTVADFRRGCENAILERARRFGLIRSAEVVSTWLSRYRGDASPPSYGEEVLLTLDGSLPADSRAKGLRRVYAENWMMSLQLAASFALDSKDPDPYRPVLAQLLGDKLKMTKLDDHSALSLILASVTLSEQFGRDVIDRIGDIPDSDILWLLSLLTERDDVYSRYFAQETLKRKLIGPPKTFFLELVSERQDLPTEVLRALVRASVGELKREDIASFGRWYDNSIEEILLTLCTTEKDPDILYETFDTVASRELVSKLGGQLIRWVRDNYWETRLTFVRGVGLVALGDRVSDEELKEGLAVFDRYVTDKTLLGALVAAESSKIAVAVIERYREVIPVSNLLLLLSDRDKHVRLAAVDSLSRTNDVGALRMIIETYEKEVDPEVRKAYEEKFWVIKQRITK